MSRVFLSEDMTVTAFHQPLKLYYLRIGNSVPIFQPKQ